jgi:hypothetical protein
VLSPCNFGLGAALLPPVINAEIAFGGRHARSCPAKHPIPASAGAFNPHSPSTVRAAQSNGVLAHRRGSQRRCPTQELLRRAAKLKRCHVCFQGARAPNSTRFFSSRLISLMQACAVEGGH